MQIVGFLMRCRKYNLTTECGKCGKVFVERKLTLVSGIFFRCFWGRNKAQLPVQFRQLFPQFEEKNSQSKLNIIFNRSIPCEIQNLLFEMVFSFDYKLLFNDSK